MQWVVTEPAPLRDKKKGVFGDGRLLALMSAGPI
jgi:hypothetical protein